jgi:cytosol alanyl aminopeptidase
MRMPPVLTATFAALLLAACAAPDPSGEGEAGTAPPADVQLDGSVRPLAYALHLAVDPGAERFSGETRIDVEILRPLSEIVLHGHGLDVSEAVVVLADGTRRAATWEEGELTVRVDVGETLAPQRATLELRYTAAFAPGLAGLYRMQQDGAWYAATQFEAIDARRAFPCFDEPRFKTPFDVVLEVPRGLAAVSNMPVTEVVPVENGSQRLRFARTPPLPTYLVAFAVGPYAIVDGAPVPPVAGLERDPVPLRFLAVQGAEPGLAHAREPTIALTQALESYFGAPYPTPKLDVIALPEFNAGAMENVGAITFRDDLILLHEPIPAAAARLFAIIIAHEVAHQWFGNLVTMPWWDDIWLNEAFATWIAYKVVEETYPEQRAAIARLTSLRSAMAEDALASARRVREPILSEHDIASAFDGITYSKGGAVLAMFERYVGEEIFREGIRRHMRRFANGSADAFDLIASLEEASGRPLRDAFASFIEQPGIPRVFVSTECTADGAYATLRQSRHLPLGSTAEAGSMWRIPACLRYGADGFVHEQCTLLAEESARMQLDACPDWVMPNAGFSGYYHFALPAQDYGKLADALGDLSAQEGLAFADAVASDFQTGGIEAATALDAMEALAAAHEPEVALAPIPFVRHVVEELLAGDPRQDAARVRAGTLYPAVAGERTFDPEWMSELPNDAERLYHAEVGRFLARTARVESVRAVALAGALAWLAGDATAVPTDALETALEVAVQDGDDATFEALLARLAEAQGSERAILAKALARATAPERSRRVLALAQSDEVRDYERGGIVLGQAGVAGNAQPTWEWLQANFDALAARMPATHVPGMTAIATNFCDDEHADEVEEFFTERAPKHEGMPRALAKNVERTRLCAALAEHQRPALRQLFGSAAGSGARR